MLRKMYAILSNLFDSTKCLNQPQTTQTQLKNIILTGITRQHQYCRWDRRKSLLHLWKFNSLITVTFPGNAMQGMVRKLTYSLGISKVRAVIRMSEFPLSDTLQWHQGLNAQRVRHEFKEILALKESLKFRLVLEREKKKKKGHSEHFYVKTWPADSKLPVAATFWTLFGFSLKSPLTGEMRFLWLMSPKRFFR